jgi:hypothetical protein
MYYFTTFIQRKHLDPIQTCSYTQMFGYKDGTVIKQNLVVWLQIFVKTNLHHHNIITWYKTKSLPAVFSYVCLDL